MGSSQGLNLSNLIRNNKGDLFLPVEINILKDLYSYKKENFKLRDNLISYHTEINKLASEIEVMESTDELINLNYEKTIANKDSIISIKNLIINDIEAREDLRILRLNNANNVIFNQNNEIAKLKYKSKWDRFVNWGWGPFRIKNIFYFASGAYLTHLGYKYL